MKKLNEKAENILSALIGISIGVTFGFVLYSIIQAVL